MTTTHMRIYDDDCNDEDYGVGDDEDDDDDHMETRRTNSELP